MASFLVMISFCSWQQSELTPAYIVKCCFKETKNTKNCKYYTHAYSYKLLRRWIECPFFNSNHSFNYFKIEQQRDMHWNCCEKTLSHLLLLLLLSLQMLLMLSDFLASVHKLLLCIVFFHVFVVFSVLPTIFFSARLYARLLLPWIYALRLAGEKIAENFVHAEKLYFLW